jgi:hypothetical protein
MVPVEPVISNNVIERMSNTCPSLFAIQSERVHALLALHTRLHTTLGTVATILSRGRLCKKKNVNRARILQRMPPIPTGLAQDCRSLLELDAVHKKEPVGQSTVSLFQFFGDTTSC